MSVTIADIMKLPSLSEAKIVAGLAGIDHTVSAISVLESSNTEKLGFDFPGHSSKYGEEIIITAFMEAKDSVEKQCEALRRLYREGEVGVILFYVGSVLLQLAPELLDLADELKMPLIVMPEKKLELRYGDVISEVVEAVVLDRQRNAYFATEVIERISHSEVSQRSINSVLAVIRDRVQCSIFVMDELGRILNYAEWPNGRGLPVNDLVREMECCGSGYGEVMTICVDGKIYHTEREELQTNDTKISALFVKEKDNLTIADCKQMKYVLKTYLNLWGENYGQLDTKQLVSAIINDEAEKMQRIAKILKINVEDLSCAYFFYSSEEDHDYGKLQQAKKTIEDFVSVYRNIFLVDIFDETVVLFADRRREKIDGDLKKLLEEMAGKGLFFRIVVSNTISTTRNVKDIYWVLQNNKQYISAVFQNKQIITEKEMQFVKQVQSTRAQRKSLSALNENWQTLFTEQREEDLVNTLEIYLLDADMNVARTAELMYVHKNTIKYRLKCVEEMLGHRVNHMPEVCDLYFAAMSNRLRKMI